ncbi:hypothetical protein QQ045_008113 [Rhodiola kirilowii]
MSVPFRATLFYGAPKASLRLRSWDLMRQLSGLSSASWCIFGDFNEILRYSETSQNAVRRRSAIEQFRNVVDDCHLYDLGFKGYQFTYSNRRRGAAETRCRLDRALANSDWRHLFPDAVLFHLSTFHSDHSPIQLTFIPVTKRSVCIFRYEAMWDTDPRFKQMLQSLWNSQANHLNFLDKLRNIQRPVVEWNHKVFGQVEKKIQTLRDALANLHQQTRTEDNIDRKKQLIFVSRLARKIILTEKNS